jgi:murein DD-endopeptidase MepM/ murein hydrolase activator NlpD
VRPGTYLGDEGDVGCATRSHLHFEVAIPRDPTDPIVSTGGFVKGVNRTPRICDISGQVALQGNQYTAAPCRE